MLTTVLRRPSSGFRRRVRAIQRRRMMGYPIYNEGRPFLRGYNANYRPKRQDPHGVAGAQPPVVLEPDGK